MFVLLFTSFYYLTNHCSLLFRLLCRVNEPKEPKDSSEPTLREAWRCGEIGEPGFVPNSIQIGRNSTNFYPISIQFFQLSGDNVTAHDEQDKQDMKKTCDLNTVIYSNQTADVLDASRRIRVIVKLGNSIRGPRYRLLDLVQPC